MEAKSLNMLEKKKARFDRLASLEVVFLKSLLTNFLRQVCFRLK